MRHFLLEDELIGQKVRDCGGWLHLREWITTGESRLINANFCKKFLLCKCCARRRAGKLVTAYGPKVESVMAANPHLLPVMITLTIKNREDLAEGIAHLKASWKRMNDAARKGKSTKSRDLKIEWNKVVGCLRAIEISRNEKTGWHPHIHVFGLVEDYIDQEKLSAEWERFTGDSFIVGVTLCKNGVKPGLIECVKYSTKFSDMDPGQVWEIFKTAAGSRFFDPQGVLRGVPEPDINEDDIAGMVGPWRDWIAMWRWGKGGYLLRELDDIAPLPFVGRSDNQESLPCETLSPSPGKAQEEPTTHRPAEAATLGEPRVPSEPATS